MKNLHYSIQSVSAVTFLAMLFLGVGCASVDGQPVHDRPLSVPLNDTSSDVSNTEVPANPVVTNKDENKQIQKFVEKNGKYRFELPSTWLTPAPVSLVGEGVYGVVGTVPSKKVVGDFSVYIAAVDAVNSKEAVSKYIAAGQGKVQLMESLTTSIPGGKVSIGRYLNKRGLEEDEYVVFTLKEGTRYAVMTVARLKTPGYEDGVQMILQTLRSL